MPLRFTSCLLLSILAALLFAAPTAFPSKSRAAGPDSKPDKLWVFVGIYTAKASKGIYRLELDLATGKLSDPVLAAEAVSPSFLAIHPNRRYLYAVTETSDFGGKRSGAVSAFA